MNSKPLAALAIALCVAGCTKPMVAAGGLMMAASGTSLVMQATDESMADGLALDRDLALGTMVVGAALITTAFLIDKQDSCLVTPCAGKDPLGWN